MSQQIKEEMEKFNREELEQEQKHLSLLKDMKGKINEAESQTETYASQADTISTILDQIKKGSAMFYLISLYILFSALLRFLVPDTNTMKLKRIK